MKRRDAIKALGTLAGAASMSKFLAACGDDGPGEITTMVFMMMENRSYDHYLGSRSWLDGKPGDGLYDGLTNPDLEGNPVAPWRNTEETWCVAADPPHGWNPSRLQFNGGLNDGFVLAHQQRHGLGAIESMQYLTGDQIPVYTALADAYTTCDRWFSSVLGPTLPNRMYWHAGTSNGADNNQDVLEGAYEGVRSLYHNLHDAGIDWAYYFVDVPVLAVLDIPEIDSHVRRIEWDFVDEAAAGTLPPICYIDPGFGTNDDHPPHHPLLGQMLISTVYNALATSPQWNNCMLVITYDENGGFYDHVPPPTAPDDHAALGFDQLGFRVPTFVIGPYAKQGYVSSVQYDHTSALKHIENVHKLQGLTARSNAANDLIDCLDLERLAAGKPAKPVTVPAVEIDETMLPDSCIGSSLRTRPSHYDHDLLLWADTPAGKKRLGRLDRRHESRDHVYAIGDYLDKHNLGRIKRRKF